MEFENYGRYWVMQPDALISIVPVSGVINPVLAATSFVRIWGIELQVTWTVQPTPLQLHIDIDGQTWVFNQANPVSTTPYFPYITSFAAPNAQVFSTVDQGNDRAFFVDGKNIAVSAETTGGTVQNLLCRVRYSRFI